MVGNPPVHLERAPLGALDRPLLDVLCGKRLAVLCPSHDACDQHLSHTWEEMARSDHALNAYHYVHCVHIRELDKGRFPINRVY